MSRGAPLRFLAGSVGAWAVLRVAATMLPFSGVPAARSPAPHVRSAMLRAVVIAVPPARAAPAPGVIPAVADARRAPIDAVQPRSAMNLVVPPVAAARAAPVAMLVRPDVPVPASPDATLAALAPSAREDDERRWSGSAWLFARAAGAGGALAPGGQLGGGQAGARVAYRVADHLALAARVSGPTGASSGAEAAAGVDWLPFGRRVAVRASLERRVAIGANARDAWSAYAAGGFYRALGGALVVDGYAQAGIVGLRRRDVFADGAVRAGARLPLSAKTALTLGAGAWAAAQPHATRLDIGPRAALSLPLGAVAGTLALDARIRVAGGARPGTGLALTLAADF